MKDVRLKIGGIELVVSGSYQPGEPENNLQDYFLIMNIAVYEPDMDISELLEWSNSLESGTVLEEIEARIIEKIRDEA